MGDRTFRVVELVDAIADALTERFGPAVWVEGEVASMSRSRHGHVYFNLVDRVNEAGNPVASIPVVLWASARDRVNAVLRRTGSIRIDDGVRIRIRGRVEIYAPRGQVQVQMLDIDPTYTLGLLGNDRDRVVQLLEIEGLLHRNRGLALPLAPLYLGLVTATGSAAEADLLQTLADSGLAWRVLHVDARVQGLGAEREVAAALRTAAAAGVEAIALVRGGGARTDLATFDHEIVARTIAGLGVPVFTGIGHETDQSVADLVAHRAERTPTACATALVEHVRAGATRAETAWTGIAHRSTDVLDRARVDSTHRARRAARAALSRAELATDRLDAVTHHLRRRAPGAVDAASARVERDAGRAEARARGHLRIHEERLSRAASSFRTQGPRALRDADRRVEGLNARIGAHDPRRALARGWSITRTRTGEVVRATIDVSEGDLVVTTVADGSFISAVLADHHLSLTPETDRDGNGS